MRFLLFLLLLLPSLVMGQIFPADGTAGSGAAGGTSFASTNAAAVSNMTVTSQCYTSSYLNTNILVTTGFGTAGANGIYNWDGISRFTNGAYFIFDHAGTDWVLSNSASGILYEAFSDPSIGALRTWDDVVGGAGPVGQDFYGPITNCFTNVVAVNGATFALGPDSTNYYVNSFIGNDTNAVAGDPYHPWRTIAGCLRVTPRNANIYITSAGQHAFATEGGTVILTNGCKLIGLGAGVTFVGTAQGAEDSLFMLSDTVIKDLTVEGKVVAGCGQQFTTGFSAEATNVFMQSCIINGAADGVGLDTWQNVTIKDCVITATYDGIANWDNRGAARSLWLKDTDILSIKTNLASELMHGISWLNGTVYMDGGSITVSNGQTHNAILYVPASTNAPSKFFLNGVRLALGNTNVAAVNLVCWFSNASQALITGTQPIEVQPLLVNSTITNTLADHIVAVTNANSTHTGGRTNKLVDTASMGTNGFLRGKVSVRVYDATGTAAGTNIWLVTQGNQKIYPSGVTETNISGNYNSVRVTVGGPGGTNWMLEGVYP